MKYCNRCFRNIFEEVSVCPYCGKADKLIDYEKERQSRGESFSCNNDSTMSSHIKKDDAYSIGDKSADDVYGNTKRHDIDNCDNSNNNYNGRSTEKSRSRDDSDYLKSLSPQERRRLIEEKREEVRRRYGTNPGATINVNGREFSVDEFRKMTEKPGNYNDKTGRSYTEQPDANKAKAVKTIAVIFIILFIFAPALAFVLLFFGIAIYMGVNKNKDDNSQ